MEIMFAKLLCSPHVGEALLCYLEFGNILGLLYAVSVITGGDVVIGHVPRKMSSICYIDESFLSRG